MSRRGLIVLVALLAVLLAALSLRLRWSLASPGERAASPAALPPTAPGVVVPSRTNVAPGFARELAVLEHSLAANAADTAALLRLARLHQDAHQPGRAAGYYRKYLALVPANRQAWLDFAAVAAATGDWDGALSATAALLARDSLDPAALFNRGAIHANRGDTVEARRWWQKAAAQARDPELAQRAAASLRQLRGARE